MNRVLDCFFILVYFIGVMFSAEVRSMLIQVITSWQVLVITFVIILYFFLVSYVAKLSHNRPRKLRLPKKKAEKKEPALDESDDLGLEDQGSERKR
jgi:hypothetical protein